MLGLDQSRLVSIFLYSNDLYCVWPVAFLIMIAKFVGIFYCTYVLVWISRDEVTQSALELYSMHTDITINLAIIQCPCVRFKYINHTRLQCPCVRFKNIDIFNNFY